MNPPFIRSLIKEGMLEELKHHIDQIHGNNRVFRESCQNGQKEIIEWLYSLGNINIHAK